MFRLLRRYREHAGARRWWLTAMVVSLAAALLVGCSGGSAPKTVNLGPQPAAVTALAGKSFSPLCLLAAQNYTAKVVKAIFVANSGVLDPGSSGSLVIIIADVTNNTTSNDTAITMSDGVAKLRDGSGQLWEIGAATPGVQAIAPAYQAAVDPAILAKQTKRILWAYPVEPNLPGPLALVSSSTCANR